jgi:hypothetical protein
MIDATINQSHAFELLGKELLNAGMNKEVWDNTRPPYPGLFAFEEEDAPYPAATIRRRSTLGARKDNRRRNEALASQHGLPVPAQ